jgi:hypothetical protein
MQQITTETNGTPDEGILSSNVPTGKDSAVPIPRQVMIDEIRRILGTTPKRVLEEAFEPATIAIQSEANGDHSYAPDEEEISSD